MNYKFKLLFITSLVLIIPLVFAIEEIGSDEGSLNVGREGGVVNIRPGEGQQSVCGDGFIDASQGEQCDGSNLNGLTCSTLLGQSYTGSLSCQPNCIYNALGCSLATTSPTPPSDNRGGGSNNGGGGGGGGSTIINSAEQSGGCIENWECQEWEACIARAQVRICTEKNNCGTTFLKPQTERLCETPALLNAPTTQETSEGLLDIVGSLLGAVIGAGANKYSASIVIGFILFIIAIALVINLVRGKQKKAEVSE